MDIEANERKLAQRIGFWGLLAMSLGINIGGSLFALTSLAAGYSGPALPLAMLVSAAPVILALVPFCVLSLAHPTTSASYRYAQLVSPTLALVYLLTSVTCICAGGLPLFALVAGTSLEAVLPVSPVATGAFMLSFFYVVNVLGIDVTARIQLLLSLVLLLALVTFIATGMPVVARENFDPWLPNGLSGVLVASGLLYTFCAGGLFVVELGDEVIDAPRNLPRALTVGMLIALSIYLGIMVVTVGVVNWSSLQGMPLAAVAETFMSPHALLFFILGGAVVASVTTINAVIAVQARLILVVSEEGLISPRLAKIGDRFGTPHRALTLIYLISLVALLANPSIALLASMLNFTMILAVTLVTLAALKVAAEHPALSTRSAFRVSPAALRVVCWTILVMNALIAGFFAFRMGWATVLFAGILLAAWGYTRAHPRRLREVETRTRATWSRG